MNRLRLFDSNVLARTSLALALAVALAVVMGLV